MFLRSVLNVFSPDIKPYVITFFYRLVRNTGVAGYETQDKTSKRYLNY